jgi:mono/diheme cytochrome c family protein
MRFKVSGAVAALAIAPALAAAGPAIDTAAFAKNVAPVLNKTCATCHNETLSSGNVNLQPFTDPTTISSQRAAWDQIIKKIRTGEMPPKGVPRPSQPAIDSLIATIQTEFDKIDRATKPDPGRVTARRLNRNEYTNTIRDLLAVNFNAGRDFPTDDSGYGFDNIGDVLTISPILMEKYLAAAESIASRALGADPLPKKPVSTEYHAKDKRIQRPDYSHIEASHRVEFDGEYIIRFGLPGERSASAKPVKMGFWMDGALLNTITVETKPSGLVYFNPFSEEEMRLYLPEGDHVFRAGFIDDDFVKNLTTKQAYDRKTNKYLESITFVGPYPSKVEKASRKKILICDAAAPGCTEKIVANLAHHAYRRPVTPAEVAGLM